VKKINKANDRVSQTNVLLLTFNSFNCCLTINFKGLSIVSEFFILCTEKRGDFFSSIVNGREEGVFM